MLFFFFISHSPTRCLGPSCPTGGRRDAHGSFGDEEIKISFHFEVGECGSRERKKGFQMFVFFCKRFVLNGSVNGSVLLLLSNCNFNWVEHLIFKDVSHINIPVLSIVKIAMPVYQLFY